MGISVGIIGYRNHSLKIIKLLVKNQNIKKIIIYCYRKNNLSLDFKEKKIQYSYYFDDIKKCDCFFITSPSSTHKNYIKKLISLKKYIFCEKPGFISLGDCKYLINLKKKEKDKIYINYNLLHSKLYDIILREKLNKFNDNLLNVTVTMSNGIAFLDKFKNNWRFKSKNILERISGNVGTHYVNFFLNLFGKISKYSIDEFAIVNKKKIDTSNIVIKFKKNSSANIFLTYAGPKIERIEFYFSNKILLFENNKLFKIGPRNTFYKSGFFKKPPKKLIYKFNDDFYNDTLKSSIKYFISKVKTNNKIDKIYFQNAIDTGLFFLKKN